MVHGKGEGFSWLNCFPPFPFFHLKFTAMTAIEFQVFALASADEIQTLEDQMVQHFRHCDYDLIRKAIIQNKMTFYSIIEVLAWLSAVGFKVQVDQEMFIEFIGEMFNSGYCFQGVAEQFINSQPSLIK